MRPTLRQTVIAQLRATATALSSNKSYPHPILEKGEFSKLWRAATEGMRAAQAAQDRDAFDTHKAELTSLKEYEDRVGNAYFDQQRKEEDARRAEEKAAREKGEAEAKAARRVYPRMAKKAWEATGPLRGVSPKEWSAQEKKLAIVSHRKAAEKAKAARMTDDAYLHNLYADGLEKGLTIKQIDAEREY